MRLLARAVAEESGQKWIRHDLMANIVLYAARHQPMARRSYMHLSRILKTFFSSPQLRSKCCVCVVFYQCALPSKQIYFIRRAAWVPAIFFNKSDRSWKQSWIISDYGRSRELHDFLCLLSLSFPLSLSLFPFNSSVASHSTWCVCVHAQVGSYSIGTLCARVFQCVTVWSLRPASMSICVRLSSILVWPSNMVTAHIIAKCEHFPQAVCDVLHSGFMISTISTVSHAFPLAQSVLFAVRSSYLATFFGPFVWLPIYSCTSITLTARCSSQKSHLLALQLCSAHTDIDISQLCYHHVCACVCTHMHVEFGLITLPISISISHYTLLYGARQSNSHPRSPKFESNYTVWNVSWNDSFAIYTCGFRAARAHACVCVYNRICINGIKFICALPHICELEANGEYIGWSV